MIKIFRDGIVFLKNLHLLSLDDFAHDLIRLDVTGMMVASFSDVQLGEL